MLKLEYNALGMAKGRWYSMENIRENHVLIVDDDEDVVLALTAVLESHGLTTVTASNGREALEVLRRPGPKPSCVLLDLHMPVMDGWEFRRQQKADPTICNIPIVVFTGSERPVSHGMPVVTVAMLMKPLGVRVIVETIVTETLRCASLR